MIKPKDFAVNEAWVAFRLQDKPINTVEGKFYIHLLMDVGSTYVIDQKFSIFTEPNSPSQEDVSDMFMKAFSAQLNYPKVIYIPIDRKSDNNFEVIAKENNIEVIYLAIDELQDVIGEAIQSFNNQMANLLK